MTLSSAEYGNPFINENPDVSLTDVLKDPAKNEIQSMVDVPIHQEDPTVQRPPLVDTVISMILEKTTPTPTQQPPQTQPKRSKTKLILNKSKKPKEQVDVEVIVKILTRLEKRVEAILKIDHSEAINKSIQAYLKKVLPTTAFNFDKLKQEKDVMQSMPKYSTKPFDEASLNEYDQKNKLMKFMMKSKSYNTHLTHKALYDTLLASLLVNEDDMDNQFIDQPTQKQPCHDDQDPPANAYKESNKRKRKDSNASPSKKSKDKEASSKEGKASSKSSIIDKVVDAKEKVHDDAMDVEARIENDFVDTQEPTQDDAAPKQDRSKSFK
ncbi:hypothetical protein Tco_1046155 [Tanacetum coccineum]